MGAGRPLDDPRRLQAVVRSGLLDSPVDEAFDRATRLATRVIGAPIALVSIVDESRQFFKSSIGLPEPWASERETPLSHSFCQYVVTSGELLAVSDARSDDLVRGNLAIRDLGVIAYLGTPLTDHEGQVLGSFCVIDQRSRQWTDDERAALGDIAGQVHDVVRARTALAQVLAELEGPRPVDAPR